MSYEYINSSLITYSTEFLYFDNGMYITLYYFKLCTVCLREQVISIRFRLVKLSVIRELACILTSYECLNVSLIFSLPIFTVFIYFNIYSL